VARKSESKGKIYYYNSATNESVWKRPATSAERPRDPSELSDLPCTTPVKNEPAMNINTKTSQLGPNTLPALELKIHSPAIRRLPPMTGLTPALASLQASRRRSQANAAKLAAEEAALSKAAVQNNSSNGVGLQKKSTLASFLKRGAEEQRQIELRRMHHASLAYCYGLAIGVFSSLFIAATAVNFGPDKTLEWLGVTGLSLIWRMFVIEPIKVLVCGGFEGVAGLITGEADDWTEGFADAFADAAEGGIEDAGVAGAGLAAMDNVNRQREKRDAAVKLAAVNAFQAAAHLHHNVPPPKTPGVRPTSTEHPV